MRRLNSQKPDGKLLEDFKASFPHLQQRSHSLAGPAGHTLADALDVAHPSRYVFPTCPPSHVDSGAADRPCALRQNTNTNLKVAEPKLSTAEKEKNNKKNNPLANLNFQPKRQSR